MDSNGKVKDVISVAIKRGDFAKGLFAEFVNKNTFVWMMQDDGYIIYDATPEEMGLHLFTAEEYKPYPELVNFGHQMQDKKYGLGHYIFVDDDKNAIVHKIAAWNRYVASDNVNWNVIVIKVFMEE